MNIIQKMQPHCSITGGEDKNTSYNIVEKYDPQRDTWSFVPSMRQKRAGAGVAVCDGKIYIAGRTQIWSIVSELKIVHLWLVVFLEWN